MRAWFTLAYLHNKNGFVVMLYQTALVVDDSKLARITLKKKIEAQGLAVSLVESGVEALDKLSEINPDVVFMDHLMPEMDGFEATRKIREQAQWQQLVIVMCTGKEHEGYLQEAKAIGADAVLAKPPTDEALQTILQTTFERVADDISPEFESIDSELETEAFDIPEVDLSFDWPDASGDDDNFEQELAEFSDSTGDEELSASNFDNAFDIDTGAEQPAPEAAAVISDEPALTAGAVQEMVDEAVEKVNDYWQQQLKQILQNKQAPTENTLDSEAVLDAVQQAMAQEKVNIIADVIAAVEQPQPVPQVDQDVLEQNQQQMLEQAMAPVNETLNALKQKAEDSPSESDVKLWLEQALAGQNSQAERAVSEQDDALLAKFEQRVQKLEALLAEQLAANTAASEGLVKEALSYVDKHLAEPNTNTSQSVDNEQLDILLQQQEQLSKQVGLPKALSSIAISLGFCALALSVYMFVG